MLHARFAATEGLTEADATAYRDALDVAYGYPRPGSSTCAAVFGNLKAQANALDPLAAWALDISTAIPLASDVLGDDTSAYRAPLEIRSIVPFPTGATTFDWTGSDPQWVAPLVGP